MIMINDFNQLSVNEFMELLYSKQPIPGGGGVAALCAAMGAALCGMVANLTYGKKKYAQYDEDIKRILEKSLSVKNKCLELVNEDAVSFAPLAQAYKLPSENEEQKQIKNKVIQNSLKAAAQTPVECIKISCEVIVMLEELSDKGNVLALSDVGVGALCTLAAIKSAWLTVLINLNLMDDIQYVKALKEEMTQLICQANESCIKIYDKVEKKLCQV
jgi:formiminotetrahydrofolate cyclodeaminase